MKRRVLRLAVGTGLAAWVAAGVEPSLGQQPQGTPSKPVSETAPAVPPGLIPDPPTAVRIRSAILGEDRLVLVRTPAAYARVGTRYPVLYLTDAEAKFHHTAATMTTASTRPTTCLTS